ncbi:hypothetical protein [Microbacterium sp. NPDC055521]
MGTRARPKILCISLSNIRSDARVLRQISALRELGDVTTIGFGDRPEGAAEHISVPQGLRTLPQTVPGVAKLAFRLYSSAALAAPAIAWSLQELEGRSFDLIVANEARALGLAHHIAAGAPVWADMHEWAPEERTHILSWRVLVAPFMTYLCRRYLPSSALITTVGEEIAALYRDRFDVTVHVMRNAGAFRRLSPSTVSSDRIRLVHSGAAIHGRKLELMIDAMRLLDSRFSLDLYLIPGGDGGAYLNQLRERAAGDPRITFHPPVAPAALPETLNRYDVGVFWIPPTHTNARLTLPNKFFDYIQARLLVAIGPSAEMSRLVERHALGTISSGFSAEKCAQSLSGLRPETLRQGKAAADAAAEELSFENEVMRLRPLLAAILD